MAEETQTERRPETTNGYQLDYLVYPPNLGWTQENANYVVFYVNVPENTVVKKSAATMGSVAPIPGMVGTSGKGMIEVKPYKRLKAAVALPISSRPQAKYGADWDMTSLGPVVGWALTESHDTSSWAQAYEDNGASGLMERGAGLMSSFGGVAGNALKAVALSGLNTAAGMLGMGGEAGTKDIFSILSRTALNEHRTQLFKSMRFRSFSFEYHFYPRDKKEAQQIRNIIHMFKYHMHPEAASGNMFLTYPSEFDIVFYFGQKENAQAAGEDAQQVAAAGQNLFKISTCALTDFEVDYGGEQFYTFSDGMPTEISMRMGFMELELLTAERIKEGF
jgi:hypothetical protein